MGKSKSSIPLIRQVTGVGRNRQVMTEYINTLCKFLKLEKLAKKKHNVGSGIKNKKKILRILKKENHKYYLTE